MCRRAKRQLSVEKQYKKVAFSLSIRDVSSTINYEHAVFSSMLTGLI